MEPENTYQHAVSDEDLRSISDSEEPPVNSEDSGYGSEKSVCSASSQGEDDDLDPDCSDPLCSFPWDSSESDEEFDSKLEYLNEKQHLLKRAFRQMSVEEAYDAAIAMVECQSRPPDDADSIWTEAKVYLQSTVERKDELKVQPQVQGERTVNKQVTNPANPLIDVSEVERHSSSVYNVETTPENATLQVLSSFEKHIFGRGQWMAQALIWSTHAEEDDDDHDHEPALAHDSHWRVISDPQTRVLGLSPPHNKMLQDSVSLQDAIAITSQPRLVCQSTPPFGVVFANKAFLLLSGLRDSKYVIGKPVETILQVTQDMSGNHATGDFLQSTIRLLNKACHIRVVPVVDRAKRRRIRNGRATLFMSHILVPVIPDETTQLPSQPRPPRPSRKPRAIPAVGRNPQYTLVMESHYESFPTNEDSIFGAIG
jgi:hypothetical protein